MGHNYIDLEEPALVVEMCRADDRPYFERVQHISARHRLEVMIHKLEPALLAVTGTYIVNSLYSYGLI